MTIVEKGCIATGQVKQMWRVVTQAAYGCERATMACDNGDGPGAVRAAAGDVVAATDGCTGTAVVAS